MADLNPPAVIVSNDVMTSLIEWFVTHLIRDQPAHTVSGNRAFIATVGVKADCTGNVAIHLVAGQVMCTGSERSRD